MSKAIIELTKSHFSSEQIELIKKTICVGATDDELKLFLYVCQQTGLDPFMKQVFAPKRGGKMTIQTSIDGFRLIAERTGRYSPGRESTYEYNDKGELVAATSYIKKMTPDGTWHEVSAKALYEEYVVKYNNKPGDFWARMPHVMLAKCAEALALRKAFPAELSKLYVEEEMLQADGKKDSVKEEQSPISDEQFILLLDEMESLPDPQAAAQYIKTSCNVSNLIDLKEDQFNSVMKIIRAKKARMEAQNGSATVA